MGALFARIFAFVAKFKKLSIIVSGIYLFSFIYLNFIEIWVQVLIYHAMFNISWYFALVGGLGSLFIWIMFIYFLPDLLRFFKKIINVFFK